MDQYYAAQNLSDADAYIVYSNSMKEGVRRQIISLRRGQHIPHTSVPGRFIRFGRAELSAHAARNLWEEVNFAHFGEDGWGEPDLMQKQFGDKWWYQMPSKPYPDYEYLCRIIRTVNDALNSTQVNIIVKESELDLNDTLFDHYP